jgi:hypothetical protein
MVVCFRSIAPVTRNQLRVRRVSEEPESRLSRKPDRFWSAPCPLKCVKFSEDSWGMSGVLNLDSRESFYKIIVWGVCHRRKFSKNVKLGRERGEAIEFSSAYRHSMTMFFPSTYPSSRSPCRNAPVRSEITEGVVALKNPIRGFSLAAAPRL